MGSSMAAAGAIRIHRTARLQVLPSEAAEEVSSGGVSSHPGSGQCLDGMAQPTAVDQSITRDGELP